MTAATHYYISNGMLVIAAFFFGRAGFGNHEEYIPLAVLLVIWSSLRRMRFWKPSIPDGLALFVLGYWLLSVYLPSLGEDTQVSFKLLIFACASYLKLGALALLVLSQWETVEDSPG